MKILTFLLPVIMISSVAVAQKMPAKDTTQSAPTSMREGILFRDGKTWYIKSLTSTMDLGNGVEVNTDGTVKTSNR